MKKKKVMVVFGTRPEAIKMGPVVKELEKYPNVFETIVCVTGQHREMLDQVLEVFKITPDFDLSIMAPNQSLFDLTSRILLTIEKVLIEVNPDIVLVHGDTTTTYITALAAFYLKISVGHVEAGLRTGDLYSPFPEEFNRHSVSIIAKYHFAPTEVTKTNLINENINPTDIFVTGNTAIDAFKYTIQDDFQHPLLDWVGESKFILLTAHRRENQGKKMEQIFKAILQIVKDNPQVKILYPVHLNPKIGQLANQILGQNDKIKLTEPLNVIEFHNIMAKAHIILTDSGGIQEEAPHLNIPVLVLRDTTERPEGIKAGTIKLIGTNMDDIVSETSQLLKDSTLHEVMAKSVNPYGNGTASQKIINTLLEGK